MVLGVGQGDLTGAFRAWLRERWPLPGAPSGGYGFLVEMAAHADRRGLRISGAVLVALAMR